MTRIGIMVHCRRLDTDAWEDLVLGQPEQNRLGDHATLARVLLTLDQSEELACIVFGRGLSWRDGLNEGDYSKRFLLDNLRRLAEFPLLVPLLERLTESERAKFHRQMAEVIVTGEVRNTVHEIEIASAVFTQHKVDKVIQIAAASHAPRCMKEQAVARSRGQIDRNQLWFTVATDMTYHNTTPESVCVIEPLHRRDQPITFAQQGLSDAISPYFALPDEDKETFIKLVADFMATRS